MKLLMYSICDKKTSYIFPFPEYSDQSAVRQFTANINGSPIAKDNPQDFELFCVGEFDMETGMIDAYIPNRHVISGLSVSRKDVIDEHEQSNPV